MSAEDRKNALLLGLRAETLASLYLQAKGYRILERRYSVPGGEVDIIARRGTVIAFVEVKARATLDLALSSIDPTKRRRMSRAAAHWLAGKDWAVLCVQRGDALCVAPWHWPRHVEGAVELRMG